MHCFGNRSALLILAMLLTVAGTACGRVAEKGSGVEDLQDWQSSAVEAHAAEEHAVEESAQPVEFADKAATEPGKKRHELVEDSQLQSPAKSQPPQTRLERYLEAAELGDAAAEGALGVAYLLGRGVLQNYQTALQWFRSAAKHGDAEGQFGLGLMYENAYAVSRDYGKAAKWYRRAAEQGHPWAQNNLGLLYEEGHGVFRDYVYAHMWINLAAQSQKVPAANGHRDRLAERMYRFQIREAQDLAVKCLRQRYRNCED